MNLHLTNFLKITLSLTNLPINYCVSLFRIERKSSFENLDTSQLKNITDNKKFWKTAKPFLANKVSSNPNKITPTQEDEQRCRFNTFFVT